MALKVTVCVCVCVLQVLVEVLTQQVLVALRGMTQWTLWLRKHGKCMVPVVWCVSFLHCVCVCVAMLEARGIPAHLLGSLGAMGSKMQHMLHSKVLSSTNSECYVH